MFELQTWPAQFKLGAACLHQQIVGGAYSVTTPTYQFSHAHAVTMKSLEKEVRLTYGKGRRGYVSVIREHYLRDDISCKVEKCSICDAKLDSRGQSLKNIGLAS